MCRKYQHILEHIFTNPVEKLKQTRRKPPNKEVLRLYREVLKFCNEFYWTNEKGEVWRDVLRESARKEFY